MSPFFERLNRAKTWFLSLSLVKKILYGAAAFVTLAFTGFFLLFIMVWIGMFGSLPGKEELQAVRNPLSTEVYSADSVLLGRYFIQERSDVRFEDIPASVVDAVVSTEDARFYEHSGVDYRSLGRVLIKSILLQNESAGGGSTLTQQLAKNLFPRKNYLMFSMPINKIREVITASRLEGVYDKNTILTLYLNTVPFADNTYGIDAAAQRFFSVRARELNTAQGAVLVGMLKATYLFNPRIFPERSTQRRDIVLAQMKKYGKLSQEDFHTLINKPLELKYNKITHHTGLAPYFREYIRPQLMEWCRTHTKANGAPYNLFTDGLKVYTTIDSRLQRYAEEAMRKQMANLQQQFASHWGKKTPWSANPQIVVEAVKRSDRYRTLAARGLSEEAIDKIMNTPVPMSVFTWHGETEKSMSPVDSIKHYLNFLQSGLLAIQPSTGSVRVWIGGIDHHFFQYDHVRESTKRQVGSTFKPIVYAAALENNVRPCQFISAEKTTYTDEKDWTPENGEDNYDMKYSMEGGLAFSVNTVSVKVLEQAGIRNTISLAERMGIKSQLPSVPSLALGVSDVSMMEMVTAYSCFVNKGRPVKPFYITAISNFKNERLDEFKPVIERKPVMSPETAQMIIHMLKRTVNEGTGARIRTRYGVTNDIAGKTGTTQSNADGWFMAMMPDLVIGCWVGADDQRIRFRSTALGQGANTALPIVATMITKSNADPGLSSVMRAHFPALSAGTERDLACALVKSDENFLQRLFGRKKEKETERKDFGSNAPEKKKKGGFLKRLFGKSS